MIPLMVKFAHLVRLTLPTTVVLSTISCNRRRFFSVGRTRTAISSARASRIAMLSLTVHWPAWISMLLGRKITTPHPCKLASVNTVICCSGMLHCLGVFSSRVLVTFFAESNASRHHPTRSSSGFVFTRLRMNLSNTYQLALTLAPLGCFLTDCDSCFD